MRISLLILYNTDQLESLVRQSAGLLISKLEVKGYKVEFSLKKAQLHPMTPALIAIPLDKVEGRDLRKLRVAITGARFQLLSNAHVIVPEEPLQIQA